MLRRCRDTMIIHAPESQKASRLKARIEKNVSRKVKESNA